MIKNHQIIGINYGFFYSFIALHVCIDMNGKVALRAYSHQVKVEAEVKKIEE